jgi:hypothetical protein
VHLPRDTHRVILGPKTGTTLTLRAQRGLIFGVRFEIFVSYNSQMMYKMFCINKIAVVYSVFKMDEEEIHFRKKSHFLLRTLSFLLGTMANALAYHIAGVVVVNFEVVALDPGVGRTYFKY